MSRTIALIGATGPLGREVLEDALTQGLRVRALARRPESIELRHAALAVVPGDVYRSETLHALLSGCDAVISALGRGALLQARKPSRLLEQGTTNLVTAMQAQGLSRLIAVSSVGVVDDPTEEWVYRHIIKKILADLYDDMRLMEDVVRKASGLDWTLVRPPLLVGGAPKGQYVTWRGENVPYGYRLPRSDLARFLVAEVTAPSFGRTVVGISKPTRRTPPVAAGATARAA